MFYFAILIIPLGIAEIYAVVNGTNGKPNEFPYIVSLQDEFYNHFCGGGIIAEDYIISAYHCRKYTLLKNIRVVAGMQSQREAADPKYVFKVEKVYRFNNKRWLRIDSQERDDRHDLMLLKLNGKIPIGEKAKIVKLPTKRPTAGEKITVAGWGDTKITDRPDVIQKFVTTIQPTQKCADVMANLNDDNEFFQPYEMCVFAKEGQGFCDGDSGSPLVKCNGELIGVVLWVPDECANGLPDYIANIYYYTDFIESHLKDLQSIYKTNNPSDEVVEIADIFQCRKQRNHLDCHLL